MSPWWRDQVRIFVSPQRLVAVRRAHGLRPVLAARHAVNIDAHGDDHGPALAALAELLRDPKWQQADAVVLLSNRFARYQLLPWTDAVLNAEEQAARARRQFAQAHGDIAPTLDLRSSDGGFGAPAMVSGVSRELLARLRDTFAASNVRLVSVQPYLMTAFNECRAELRRGAHWFAVVESGSLCTALVTGGRWASLRTRRIGGEWNEELLLALHRQSVADDEGPEARSVIIHAADEAPEAWPAQAGWTVRQLRSPAQAHAAATGGRPYGLALAGTR
ncbi:MAG TPA: hypothetical protein VF522_05415 [Ramlibacter sp.]|uniref:hypothetical protein n=1 Tax=Ramlibacter sp. TaxID=1917967 RepID=UPI002ED14AA9